MSSMGGGRLAWRGRRRRWGRPRKLPPLECLFHDEAVLFVQRSSVRRGVEFDARDSQRIQKLEGADQQPLPETLPAMIGVDDEHADPGEPRASRRGDGQDWRLHRRSWSLCRRVDSDRGGEAAVRLRAQESHPVGGRLIPADLAHNDRHRRRGRRRRREDEGLRSIENASWIVVACGNVRHGFFSVLPDRRLQNRQRDAGRDDPCRERSSDPPLAVRRPDRTDGRYSGSDPTSESCCSRSRACIAWPALNRLLVGHT